MIQYNQPLKKDIAEDLQLSDFNWNPSGVYFNLNKGTTFIDVSIEKDGAINQRTFKIKQPAQWNEQSIINELLKLKPFIGSKKS